MGTQQPFTTQFRIITRETWLCSSGSFIGPRNIRPRVLVPICPKTEVQVLGKRKAPLSLIIRCSWVYRPKKEGWAWVEVRLIGFNKLESSRLTQLKPMWGIRGRVESQRLLTCPPHPITGANWTIRVQARSSLLLVEFMPQGVWMTVATGTLQSTLKWFWVSHRVSKSWGIKISVNYTIPSMRIPKAP
jgi:hypothetical protein